MNTDNGWVAAMDRLTHAEVESGNWIPVSDSQMTTEQKERFKNNDQPVVKEADQKSELAKIRNEERKKKTEEETKKVARKVGTKITRSKVKTKQKRTRNKIAKQTKRKQRKKK